MTDEEVAALTLRLPVPLYDRLRLMVFTQKRDDRGASMNALIISLVREGLERRDAASADQPEQEQG